MIFIIIGLLLISYDIFILVINQPTFWDAVFSFTHIWSIAGLFISYCGFYKVKNKISFIKTWKKWLRWTAGFIFGFCLVISAVNLIFILTPEKAKISDDADYVILLGGGIDKNGVIPEVVEKRVEKTAEYLLENENALCAVSGGQVHWSAFSEAPVLKKRLIDYGISEERIIIEDQALDTIQNLTFGCRVLSDYTGKTEEEILSSKVLIVTSNFHLARALRIAGRLGYKNVKGIGSKLVFYKVPNSYAREIAAYVKLNLRILFTGKPEKII